MSTPTPEFLRLYTLALRGGVETTIPELIAVFEIADSELMLNRIERAQSMLDEYQLELVPPITSSDINSTRILRSKHRQTIDADTVMPEIARGELPTQEFKSTLQYDTKRAQAQPDTPLSSLRAEFVIHSALKTIAAFLNCSGGVLYVGVTDSGDICGLVQDYSLIKDGNSDKWETELRNLLESNFKNGKSINDYVSVVFVSIGDKQIARISVQARRSVSFLKYYKTKELTVYRRQGNRSVEVAIDEFEEFLQNRK